MKSSKLAKNGPQSPAELWEACGSRLGVSGHL